VSISIDPEFDTPARLREYARKLVQAPSGRLQRHTAASQAAQRAFGVYRETT